MIPHRVEALDPPSKRSSRNACSFPGVGGCLNRIDKCLDPQACKKSKWLRTTEGNRRGKSRDFYGLQIVEAKLVTRGDTELPIGRMLRPGENAPET